jgi:hypothetical protein
MHRLFSKVMSTFDFYHHYVTLHYSTFTLFMQLLTVGFGLASCITGFRHKFMWITAIGCLLDTIVTTILANTAMFLILHHAILLFYAVVPPLLIFYTVGRMVISSYFFGETQNLSDPNYICHIICVITHIILWFPFILITVVFIVWLI